MEKQINFNIKYFGLDLLIKGSVFIWLYRAIGIQQVVSFPALFLALGVETVFFLAYVLLAAIIAWLAFKTAHKHITEMMENPRFDEDGYEYYEE